MLHSKVKGYKETNCKWTKGTVKIKLAAITHSKQLVGFSVTEKNDIVVEITHLIGFPWSGKSIVIISIIVWIIKSADPNVTTNQALRENIWYMYGFINQYRCGLLIDCMHHTDLTCRFSDPFSWYRDDSHGNSRSCDLIKMRVSIASIARHWDTWDIQTRKFTFGWTFMNHGCWYYYREQKQGWPISSLQISWKYQLSKLFLCIYSGGQLLNEVLI